MEAQAAQSFLLSLSKCLWSYEKGVCVCPAFSELASSQSSINKEAGNEDGGDGRHLPCDRCCSRRFSAFSHLTLITTR